MTVRATDDLVGGIIDVDVNISLTPFIAAANVLVTEFCTDLTTDYTDAHLIKIETWLAAHFYTVREPRVISEKVGPVGENFQNEMSVDLGFSTSHYGQMAMRLDYYGGLARLDIRIKKGVRVPKLTWVGKEKDDL